MKFPLTLARSWLLSSCLALLPTGDFLPAHIANPGMEGSSASTKVRRVPKCGLVGTWRGNITIPQRQDFITTWGLQRR
jgi:hypothetical protein